MSGGRTTKSKSPSPNSAWPNLVIRASAGTGKTFQLSNRYLQLVGAGVKPESILAATFARKAAGEILARVVERLAVAALNDKKCSELAEQVGWQLDRAGCSRLLAQLIHNLHRLRIGTLDSFFVRLAGSFALELGLPSDWRIVEPIDDNQWRLEAIRRVLGLGEKTELHAMFHLLFKGETARSITAQVLDLVKNLYEIHCETGEPAWHELKHRQRLRPEELEQAIDALAAAPQPANGHFANAWRDDVGRARDEGWQKFIATGLAGALAQKDGIYRAKPIDPDLAALYRPLVGHATAVLVNQIVDQTQATWKVLSSFAVQYQAIQHERSGLMFADVPRRLAAAIDGGMWDQASWRLDGSISHLLVDEFQDTSLSQWRVLRPLAKACCQSSAGRSFFAVGDVKQAIYRWRGGVSQIFDAATEELSGVREQSLFESRRSSQAVIDVVNQVFGQVTGNAALKDFTEAATTWHTGFVEHTTAKKDLAGYVELSVAPQAAEGEKQAEQTLQFAAEKIALLSQEHPDHKIGVLVRTNGAVRQLIHRLRSEHDVLASEEGGNPLTDSPAVEIAMSALTLADHPGDTAARFHVAHSPLGPKLGIITHDDHPAAHQAMALLRAKLLDGGYGRTLYAWAQALSQQCDQHDLRRLEQLVAMGYSFDQRAGVRPSEFVTLVRETRVEDPSAERVRVMTVHQAKGLEFDVVVLPELEKDLKPRRPPDIAVGRGRPIDPVEIICRYANESIQSLLPERFQKIFEIWPREAVGESLCLLYVAMTRAVHVLQIVVAPTTLTKDGPSKTIPKTFAGFLRSALNAGKPFKPETIAYTHGDPAWDLAPVKRRTAKPPTEKSTPAAPQSIRLRTSGRALHLDRRSPSELEGGNLVRAGDLLRTGSAVFARGSLWHAWLEKIEWLDDDSAGRLDKGLFRAVDRSLTAGLDVEAELEKFWKTVVAGPIAKTLSRSAYADPAALGFPPSLVQRLGAPDVRLVVERERRFALVEEGVLVSGSLDRLVSWQTADGQVLAADLIDFKTDRIDSAQRLDERVAFYTPQLVAYCRAVQRLHRFQPEAIVGRLVFLDAGKVRLIDS